MLNTTNAKEEMDEVLASDPIDRQITNMEKRVAELGNIMLENNYVRGTIDFHKQQCRAFEGYVNNTITKAEGVNQRPSLLKMNEIKYRNEELTDLVFVVEKDLEYDLKNKHKFLKEFQKIYSEKILEKWLRLGIGTMHKLKISSITGKKLEAYEHAWITRWLRAVDRLLLVLHNKSDYYNAAIETFDVEEYAKNNEGYERATKKLDALYTKRKDAHQERIDNLLAKQAEEEKKQIKRDELRAKEEKRRARIAKKKVSSDKVFQEQKDKRSKEEATNE